jgi:uncharacterized MAPEG superfamily protein
MLICARSNPGLEGAMTTELFYLFLSSILLTVLWIPTIVGQASTAGPLTADEYRFGRKNTDFPHWVRRADRAHINLVEQFGAFAGLVVVAHFAGVSNAVTEWCAAIFFWARLAHAIIYMAGIPYLRTAVFTVGFLSLLVYAGTIFANYQSAVAS